LSPVNNSSAHERLFWTRPGLEIRDGHLLVAGRDAAALARRHGTPLYVFDMQRIGEMVRALQGALTRAGLRGQVRLAMKAQREPDVLAFVRQLGRPGTAESVGLDVCSPRELLHGLEHGWTPAEISYTGTNLSERDLDVVLAHAVNLNVDLLSQIRRVGRRARGRTIGLRLNPRAGAAWGGEGSTLYSSAKPTKFGIYAEQLDGAVALARKYDLTISTAHFHVGDGFLDDGLPAFDEAVAKAAAMVGRLLELGCPIREVNAGGGLGVPLLPGEKHLDLDAYARILERHLGSLDVVVATEPGDFLTKESGALLGEVVTVEDRLGTTFVGLDVGWNVMNDRFIYGVPFELAVCERADAEPTQRVTVAGNINEGDDLFAEDYPFPEAEEGDIVAIINCGGYNQAMSMEHCLRPHAQAVYFDDRRTA
jgi:diaminopimelate decarboxylase